MTDWSEGYVKGIDYNPDAYPELNPTRARLPFLNAGLRFPARVETACELGFGFGLSPNVCAAASAAEWWGTDFNPAQAAFARELAAYTGANAHLFDEPFAEFCNRPDLPEFDFIGLHGVWTWVSEANRLVILDFLRRKLKPGGVVYASYNTLPGWAQILPLRKLLTDHAETASPAAMPIGERIDAAIAFAESVLAASPGMAQLYPLMVGRLKALPGYAKSYVAHEFFNRDWEPMLFSEIAGRMGGAKLSFACSADMPHHFDRHNLSAPQMALLAATADPTMRETTRDYMINRQFRKDYWVKGARRLDRIERQDALLAHRIILAADPSAITGEVDGALSGRTLDEAVLRPLVELMADRAPHTIGEIAGLLGTAGITFGQVVEAAMILVGKGRAASVADDAEVSTARANSRRFNEAVVERSGHESGVSNLASPITGGGVLVPSLHQKFLRARLLGGQTPAQWAETVWAEYLAHGTRVVRGGKMLESPEENIEALTLEAEAFAATRLPILIALGLAE